MLKVGDTVKVVSKTDCGGGVMNELIPIGTICRVTEVCNDQEGIYYGIVDIRTRECDEFMNTGYYLENELEKGHLEWIKD